MDHATEELPARAPRGQLPLTSSLPGIGGYGQMLGGATSTPTPKQSLDRAETPPSRPSTLMGFMMSLSDFSSTLVTSTQARENTSHSGASGPRAAKGETDKGTTRELYKDVVTVIHLESPESWGNGVEYKNVRDGSATRKRWAGLSGCFCGFSSGQD